MSDFRTLKILDLFKLIFQLFRIDYDMMRKIVAVKLMMDQRRVPTIFQQSKKKEGNQFIKSLGIYALYSLILIPFVFGDRYMLQLSIFFGILMFILMTSLISDFSAVLLDVRDKTILHTKPITKRTATAAKFVHITIYLSLLTGTLIAIPSIIMIGVQGITFFLVFLVEVIFLVLLILTMTALVYIFILRYFSGEQLKDIINYVQIALSIGVIVGYQLVIRSFDVVDFDVVYLFQWWHLFIPSIWFAAPHELLWNHNFTQSTIILSSFAFIIPILFFTTYYRLMPTFEQNLQKLIEETGNVKQKKRRLLTLFGRILCRTKEERMFFRFSEAMMSRDREFKLKVYPSLGMGLVFPFIFIFSDLSSRSLAEIGASKMYLNIYFATIIIGVVIHTLQYSGKYKGAWIFQVTPIKESSRIYSATLKAFIVKFYLPIFLFISIVFITIFSIKVIPHLVIALLSAILHMLITYKMINNEDYPFTKPFETAQQSGNTALMFMLMFVTAIFVGIHFVATLIPYGVAGYLLLLVVVTIICWKLVFPYKKRDRELIA